MQVRKQQLLDCFKNCDDGVKAMVTCIIEDMVFLEIELDKLRKLPHIRIHPQNSCRQELTPAARLYKDYLSRYTDIIGRLSGILKKNEFEEVSPLRAYMESLKK